MNLVKNTFKLLLLAISIIFTFWLIFLLIVFFTVDVGKVKSFTSDFIQENTNTNLSTEDLSLKLFPNINLNFSNVVLSKQTNSEKIIEAQSFEISINIFKIILGNAQIDININNAKYYKSASDIDFSLLAYTYASFLFFSKYNILINSLKIFNNDFSNLEINSSFFIDPLKQKAYADSKIVYFNNSYDLNTKIKLSNDKIFENISFAISTKDLTSSGLIKMNGVFNRLDGLLNLDKLNLIINDKKINIDEQSISFSDNLNFNIKTELASSIFLNIYPFLEDFIKGNSLVFSSEFIGILGVNKINLSTNLLLKSKNYNTKLSSVKINKIIVLFENSTSKSIKVFDENNDVVFEKND